MDGSQGIKEEDESAEKRQRKLMKMQTHRENHKTFKFSEDRDYMMDDNLTGYNRGSDLLYLHSQRLKRGASDNSRGGELKSSMRYQNKNLQDISGDSKLFTNKKKVDTPSLTGSVLKSDLIRRSSPGKFSIHAAQNPTENMMCIMNLGQKLNNSIGGSYGREESQSPKDIIQKASQTDYGFYNYQ